jgi:hypothetical protein
LLLVFKTFDFLPNLPMGPVSQSVIIQSAKKACLGQKLLLSWPIKQL